MSGYKMDDLDYYKNRCRDLEAQMQRMEVRLQMMGKGEQMQHQDLVIEIEKFQKLAAQRKNEADLWKQKYETQMSQIMQIKNNYEMELSQLSQEVQRLLDKIDTFEYEQHNTRQLKECIMERDIEMQDLVDKIQRIQKNSDEEVQRQSRECEQLRHKINVLELEKQKELEQVRFKAESYHAQNVDNLKKSHQSQLQVVESENDKLRNLLEIKNAEIETLLAQNMKLKAQQNESKSEGQQKFQELESVHKSTLLECQNLQSRVDQYCEELELNRQELEEMDKSIRYYQDEVKQLEQEKQIVQDKLRNAESKIRTLDQSDELQNRIVTLEEEKLQELENLREKLEQSAQYQINNLKTAFNTQINILTDENKDLANAVKVKEQTIQDLLNKYQQLEKAQSMGPQEMASKNIYEMYLRSKNRVASFHNNHNK